jgi:hypothetical protein
MRSIVISDLHNRFHWVEYYLAAQTYDEVIFIGDYFDDRNDTPAEAEATAKWLKESLRYPNRIHLLGNHDIWYGYGCGYAACAGNTPEKKEAIDSVLSGSDWEKMELCHFSQNYLFSHAGIHEHWFRHPVHGVYREYVQRICCMGRRNLRLGNPDPIFMAGQARGGGYGKRPGGITWLDFNHEFKPIYGLNQIVGHTPHLSPDSENVIKYMPNKIRPRSINYCIDFHNKWITIVEDGTVSFEKSPLHPENHTG